MGLRCVWIFPLGAFGISISTFFICYGIAVYNGHVTALWPYISDNGSMSPESCIFGLMLSVASFFLLVTVYIRHRQIVEFYWHHHKKEGKWRHWSTFILWLGIISSLGVLIVANFQEINVIVVHYFGAFLAFGVGLIYIWAQTVFSYAMTPRLAHVYISHLRLIISIAASVCFIGCINFGMQAIAPKDVQEEHEKNCKSVLKWEPSYPNYAMHTLATVFEWLLAGCFQLYILSFAIELRGAYCHAPKLRIHGEQVWLGKNKVYIYPSSVSAPYDSGLYKTVIFNDSQALATLNGGRNDEVIIMKF